MAPILQGHIDAISLAARFKKEILEKRPNPQDMRDEIRMNALKIRPFAGDLFSLNMTNPKFISTLWGLLRLEEYVAEAESKLPNHEIDLFFKLMRQYKDSLQNDINKIDLRLPHLKSKGVNVPITMEIFRDLPKRKKKRVN